MTKLTPELVLRFERAKQWFQAHDGYIEEVDLDGWTQYKLRLPNGGGGEFALEDPVPGEYEECFADVVREIPPEPRNLTWRMQDLMLLVRIKDDEAANGVHETDRRVVEARSGRSANVFARGGRD